MLNDQVAKDNLSINWGTGARVGVIGGMGEMGRLFSMLFEQCGWHVVPADLHTERNAREVIESSDIVVFAVPLDRTVSIIRELIPYTREGQLLMDLSSLKSGPVQEMLRSASFVVGLHPMFGGRVSSFEGQTLVACPARIPERDWAGLKGLFMSRGMRVKECTPAEHDRMMSIIQVLFHMTTMLTGRILREMGVDIAETMDYTSPSYRLEMNLLGRIFAQNAALYSAITQMNPFTGDIISLLKEALEHYQHWYEGQDLGSFIRDFEHSAAHLGEFSRKAFQESSEILDFSVQLASRGDGGR